MRETRADHVGSLLRPPRRPAAPAGRGRMSSGGSWSWWRPWPGRSGA